MPNVINGTSTGSGGLITSGDDSGILNIQTNETTAISIDASQSVDFTNNIDAPNTFGFKNRIINGAMVIDQRNAGASVTPVALEYQIDRWRYFASQASKITMGQNQGAVTPPAGFSNYLGITSSSAYAVLVGDFFGYQQFIEGFNAADLAWGTANAQTVTLSFWVRSSLTGTFGGSIQNSATTRSYPFSYTISAATTWEQKTITIAGDTTGTWLTTNGRGISVNLMIGAGSTVSGTAGAWAAADYRSATGAVSVVGTNGATFYITGVQFEKGTQATSFDFRSYGTELNLCYRYFYKTSSEAATVLGVGFVDGATSLLAQSAVPVPMRTSATLVTSGTASDYRIRWAGSQTTTLNAVPLINSTIGQYYRLDCGVAGGLTTGYGGFLTPTGANGSLGYSAEL